MIYSKYVYICIYIYIYIVNYTPNRHRKNLLFNSTLYYYKSINFRDWISKIFRNLFGPPHIRLFWTQDLQKGKRQKVQLNLTLYPTSLYVHTYICTCTVSRHAYLLTIKFLTRSLTKIVTFIFSSMSSNRSYGKLIWIFHALWPKIINHRVERRGKNVLKQVKFLELPTARRIDDQHHVTSVSVSECSLANGNSGSTNLF
jgi:hypothetical protein